MTELTTRERILRFSKAFGRPINDRPVELSESDRLLLGKLMFEEVVEYVTKGMGLEITGKPYDSNEGAYLSDRLELIVAPHSKYDPIESADGLGDIHVVAHFNSNWHGWNLDAVTAEIDDSNMSKLDENGEPIINGLTPGYRNAEIMEDYSGESYNETGFDPSKPVGKILKGPNYRAPDIAKVIFF
jgi:hypothetical protein